MAAVDSSIANVVQISLKTNIKAIKIALSKSRFLDSTCCVTLNINSGLTWDNLFKNLDILSVSAQRYVIRGGVKKYRIVEANLHENIYKFIGKFETTDIYTARIEMAKKTKLTAPVSPNKRVTRSSLKKRSDESVNLNPIAAKKRRGRPPKKQNVAVSSAAGSVTMSDESVNLNPIPAKKRRGRPPKKQNVAVSSAAGSVTMSDESVNLNPIPAKTRRGRPPKKQNVAVSSAAGSVTMSDESVNLNPIPAKKRRGRPPKKQNVAVSSAAGSVTIIAPVAADNNSAVLPRNGTYFYHKNTPSTSSGARSNDITSVNLTFRGRKLKLKPILNDNGNVEEDESEVDEASSDDWERESDFSELSVFTNVHKNPPRPLARPQAGNNSPKSFDEIRAAIAESLDKSLDNAFVWRVKKEIDEAKGNGIWNQVTRHIPRIGNFFSKVFEEAFSKAG